MLLMMRVALSAAVLLAALSTQSNPISSAMVAKLIEQELATARVPGAAIAVVAGDDVYAGSFGVAESDAARPMTPTTLLHVGSLTKVFTALAVIATLDAKRLPLDTPVGKVMPGLTASAAATT